MIPFGERQMEYIRRLLNERTRTRADIVKIVRNIKGITLKEAKKEVHWIMYRVIALEES